MTAVSQSGREGGPPAFPRSLAEDARHLPALGNFSGPPKLPSASLTKLLTGFLWAFLELLRSYSKWLAATVHRYNAYNLDAVVVTHVGTGQDLTVASARATQDPELGSLQPGGSPWSLPGVPRSLGLLGERSETPHGAASFAGFVFLWTFSSPEMPEDFNIHSDSLEITMFNNRKLKINRNTFSKHAVLGHFHYSRHAGGLYLSRC